MLSRFWMKFSFTVVCLSGGKRLLFANYFPLHSNKFDFYTSPVYQTFPYNRSFSTALQNPIVIFRWKKISQDDVSRDHFEIYAKQYKSCMAKEPFKDSLSGHVSSGTNCTKVHVVENVKAKNSAYCKKICFLPRTRRFDGLLSTTIKPSVSPGSKRCPKSFRHFHLCIGCQDIGILRHGRRCDAVVLHQTSVDHIFQLS